MARHSDGPWYRKAKDTWYVWHGGRQHSLKVKGKGNRADAVKAWHQLMAEDKAEPPGPSVRPRPVRTPPAPPEAEVTVKAVADAFLADAQTRCKPESMSVYRSALGRFAKRFGSRPALSLRPFDAEGFANRPDWSPSTRNTWLSAVATAFRWAVRSGLIPANPLAGMRKPPCGSRGASAVLTPGQFAKLCDAAPLPFRRLLRSLWLTGCRPGEMARLTAADVDLTAGLAVLAEHKTSGKTGRPRFIYLSPDAVALLREQAERHPTGPLLPNKLGRAFTRFTMQKAMEAARDKAGVPHAVCYGLRHSYATAALASGVPDATVAALLGHSGTAMLHRHYSHLVHQSQAMREAAARVRG